MSKPTNQEKEGIAHAPSSIMKAKLIDVLELIGIYAGCLAGSMLMLGLYYFFGETPWLLIGYTLAALSVAAVLLWLGIVAGFLIKGWRRLFP
ncbi:MAG: hypothetical protein QOD75_129 [Blastocatellia bacterium]|jgi:hypothetical protein|nr:hypothetical protein [Blastocatellia bacterium]